MQALDKQVDAARAGVEVSKAAISRRRSILPAPGHHRQKQSRVRAAEGPVAEKATSQKALEQAQANYEISVQEKIGAEAALYQSRASLAESQATLAEAEAQLGALGDANPQLRAALATLRQAELNLEFTEVRAPVDGYVTNLNLRLGSQVVANQPVLALWTSRASGCRGFSRGNGPSGACRPATGPWSP